MEFTQIIALIGALGIGGFIGVLAQSFFNQKLNDKKMLFDARLQAYKGITGRVFNLFLEPDIVILKDRALIFAKLNQLFSEASLMASHDLANFLGDYKVKVWEFHVALEEKDDKKSGRLHKEIVQLAGKIHEQMRRDLHVDNKAVFDKKPEVP